MIEKEYKMKKLEIITRPEKLVVLKKIFTEHRCNGMTVSSVMGCGRQKGYLPEMSVTADSISLLPKILVFVVVRDDQLEEILADIATNLSTGKNGDGKVFVTEIIDVMRIRTNDRGSNALD
jgi:nitrogen regulatory protein P-II 1